MKALENAMHSAYVHESCWGDTPDMDFITGKTGKVVQGGRPATSTDTAHRHVLGFFCE